MIPMIEKHEKTQAQISRLSYTTNLLLVSTENLSLYCLDKLLMNCFFINIGTNSNISQWTSKAQEIELLTGRAKFQQSSEVESSLQRNRVVEKKKKRKFEN